MTVQEMLSKMDSKELSEWMAYAQLEARKTRGEQEPGDITKKVKDAFFPFKANKE